MNFSTKTPGKSPFRDAFSALARSGKRGLLRKCNTYQKSVGLHTAHRYHPTILTASKVTTTPRFSLASSCFPVPFSEVGIPESMKKHRMFRYNLIQQED
jgi:hypothetical protein